MVNKRKFEIWQKAAIYNNIIRRLSRARIPIIAFLGSIFMAKKCYFLWISSVLVKSLGIRPKELKGVIKSWAYIIKVAIRIFEYVLDSQFSNTRASSNKRAQVQILLNLAPQILNESFLVEFCCRGITFSLKLKSHYFQLVTSKGQLKIKTTSLPNICLPNTMDVVPRLFDS